jgi:hypothetical protein
VKVTGGKEHNCFPTDVVMFRSKKQELWYELLGQWGSGSICISMLTANLWFI